MNDQDTPAPAPEMPVVDPQTRALTVQRNQSLALTAAQQMAAVVDVQLEMIEGLANIGNFMVKSGMFPATLDTPEKAGVVAMTAFELGLTLAQAARFIDVIEGRPFVRAKMRMALVNSRGPGRMFVTARTPEYVTARGERPGFPVTEVTYRLTDAQRAGLLGKKAWQQDPVDMMVARATAKLADILWPEIGAGLPMAEEVDDGLTEALHLGDEGFEATVVEGTFREVTDPPATDTSAADQLLKAAKGDRGSGPGRPSGDRPPARNSAFAELTRKMGEKTPPLRMREVALVAFPSGNGSLSAEDLDRWLFEGNDDDPHTVDALIAAALARRNG